MIITAMNQPVFNEPQENLAVFRDVFEMTKDSDLVLTPEGALSGYCMTVKHENKTNSTERRFLPIMSEVQQMSAQYNTDIIVGTGWREEDGLPYNQQRLYSDGELLCAYSKRLLCSRPEFAGEYVTYAAGRFPQVWKLSNGVRAGFLICNDVWAYPPVSTHNPYYYYEYENLGVQIMFVSVNCNVTKGGSEQIKQWHTTHLEQYSRTHSVYTVVSSATTAMNGELADLQQCPTGIIAPDGNWLTRSDSLEMQALSYDINW